MSFLIQKKSLCQLVQTLTFGVWLGSAGLANSQIFVVSYDHRDFPPTTYGQINAHGFSGESLGAPLVEWTSVWPAGLSVWGDILYVFRGDQDGNAIIGAYSTSGVPINESLITGLDRYGSGLGIAVDGTFLYVANWGGTTVAKYTLAGELIDAEFISGLIAPTGMTISDGKLFVASKTEGTIGAFTLTGDVISRSFVTGLENVNGIAADVEGLYVVQTDRGVVSKFSPDGSLVNANLISGISTPVAISVYAGEIFVGAYGGDLPASVGRYTTDGVPIDPDFITGLSSPWGIAVIPEPGPTSLLVVAGAVLFGIRMTDRRKPNLNAGF